jgi:hypothetical protein
MMNIVKSILKAFIVKAGFVDSNRASYVPMKLATEVITKGSVDGTTQYYDYQGTKRTAGFIVTGAWADNKVVAVTFGATEGYVKPVAAKTDVVIGYTNGDPELVLTEGSPVRYSNIRINGYVMTGVLSGTAAVAYGGVISYTITTQSTRGLPTIVAGADGATEGSKMLALQAATAAEATAGKQIDFLVLL